MFVLKFRVKMTKLTLKLIKIISLINKVNQQNNKILKLKIKINKGLKLLMKYQAIIYNPKQ